MKHLSSISFFAVALLVCSQCSTSKEANISKDKGLSTLVEWMCGDFSSQAQSVRDSDFYDIRLHIRPIWTADKSSHWLYVEQATAKAENKPYRQRVYKVEKGTDGVYKSIVYTLSDPENWVNAYKSTSKFDDLKPVELLLRDGCTVFLTKKGSVFEGATQGDGCESTLRGAKYARSTVTVTSTMLKSWDQGFNDKNEQVWGATKGGYEFVKQ